jgi:hypothetical protein
MKELGLLNHDFYSSGVMLFRRGPATDRLFAAWHEEWSRFGHEDQLAMARAIARTGFPVHTLAPKWNGRIRVSETVEDAQARGARIVHLRSGNAQLTNALLNRLPPSPGDAGTASWWLLFLRLRGLTTAAANRVLSPARALKDAVRARLRGKPWIGGRDTAAAEQRQRAGEFLPADALGQNEVAVAEHLIRRPEVPRPDRRVEPA